MRKSMLVGAVATVLAAAVVFCVAQDGMEDAGHSTGGMPVFKAGPEQEGLKRLVGKWTSEMTMPMGPGMPDMKSTGSSEITMVGEFWAVERATFNMMDTEMAGLGIYGYDIVKKAHTSKWVDSYAPYAMDIEGTVDKDGKMVMTGMGPDMAMNVDNLTEYKMVGTWVDDDTRTMDMFIMMPDGQEMKIWSMTAKRAE
ncbi:MAG: DUF1579 family protein [Candidatus Sumerlaeia bacterium]|nr:DUF1579 family protein [Candidatus Sumerlaeia bacterium]